MIKETLDRKGLISKIITEIYKELERDMIVEIHQICLENKKKARRKGVVNVEIMKDDDFRKRTCWNVSYFGVYLAEEFRKN